MPRPTETGFALAHLFDSRPHFGLHRQRPGIHHLRFVRWSKPLLYPLHRARYRPKRRPHRALRPLMDQSQYLLSNRPSRHRPRPRAATQESQDQAWDAPVRGSFGCPIKQRQLPFRRLERSRLLPVAGRSFRYRWCSQNRRHQTQALTGHRPVLPVAVVPAPRGSRGRGMSLPMVPRSALFPVHFVPECQQQQEAMDQKYWCNW